ncbi:MAG: hypothetical protein MUQ25_19440 [Candidatus Aminicenantes bacterium]|nr:hypothetical protein [Candidatus Aminicenantes bacterium]
MKNGFLFFQEGALDGEKSPRYRVGPELRFDEFLFSYRLQNGFPKSGLDFDLITLGLGENLPGFPEAFLRIKEVNQVVVGVAMGVVGFQRRPVFRFGLGLPFVAEQAVAVEI